MDREDLKDLRIAIAKVKGLIAGILQSDQVFYIHYDAEQALDCLQWVDYILNTEAGVGKSENITDEKAQNDSSED